ncbi:hypothetical protein [Streptomyces sp. NEAU-NA10]|uniref:hypothetical protein n=1 Tax=Streptomyces sp. NEAU-NA10 TaxID=3416050 RepID=UPI003CC59C6E
MGRQHSLLLTEEERYEVRFTKPFGEKLHIPGPFGCALDTTGFQAPEEQAETQAEA